MHGVHVGAGAVVRNAIIDKSVDIPPGTRIGVDQEADRARGFMVEDGLTILGKGQSVELELTTRNARSAATVPWP